MPKRRARQVGGTKLTGGPPPPKSKKVRTACANSTSSDGRDRARGVIIASTNVGSLGSDPISDNNIIVRRQLHDGLVKINNQHGGIDALALQECMNDQVELLPFFSLPAASDSGVTFGKNDNGVRGVCCYTRDGLGEVKLADTTNEICVVVRSYVNKRGAVVRFGIINCYRNQSVNYERSSATTLNGIYNAFTALKRLNVNLFLVTGDFNDTVFSIPGLREIRHPDLYHQANASTRKRKIDKIFTNIDCCGILQVYSSCENVHDYKEDGELVESDFGHKLICLYVGAKPNRIRQTTHTFPKMKMVRSIAKERLATFPVVDSARPVEDTEYTDYLARVLTEKCQELLQAATITIVNRKRNNQLIMMSALEEHADHGTHRKQKLTNRWKSTYAFNSKIKQGIGDCNDDSVRPELPIITEKLNKKLKNLNVMNRSVAFPAAEALFPVNLENRGPILTNKEKLKHALNSVNNSGAIDYLGMSLKHTKTIFSSNIDFRKFFREIICPFCGILCAHSYTGQPQ